MTRTEVGMLLARARIRAGMTQSKLAEAMETTQPVVARAEGGYRLPTIEFLDRWATATGAPLSLTFGAKVESG
ncbi:MAG: helix-turn-helix transcriptional regulator, partial [Chloroflexi bacterium]